MSQKLSAEVGDIGIPTSKGQIDLPQCSRSVAKQCYKQVQGMIGSRDDMRWVYKSALAGKRTGNAWNLKVSVARNVKSDGTDQEEVRGQPACHSILNNSLIYAHIFQLVAHHDCI